MAKGQIRGNKEARKPKADKPKATGAAPALGSAGTGTPAGKKK